MQVIKVAGSYRKRRRDAYPPVCDQLDAMVKLGQALRDQGIALPADVNAWIDACQEVKRKHPKPK